MAEQDLRKYAEELLVRVCDSEAVLEKDIDLLDSGLLDSLAFIELLSELELDGIDIQPTRVDRNMFRTVDGIIELIKNAQQ